MYLDKYFNCFTRTIKYRGALNISYQSGFQVIGTDWYSYVKGSYEPYSHTECQTKMNKSKIPISYRLFNTLFHSRFELNTRLVKFNNSEIFDVKNSDPAFFLQNLISV